MRIAIADPARAGALLLTLLAASAAGCGGQSSVDTSKPLEINTEAAAGQNKAMEEHYKANPPGKGVGPAPARPGARKS